MLESCASLDRDILASGGSGGGSELLDDALTSIAARLYLSMNVDSIELCLSLLTAWSNDKL